MFNKTKGKTILVLILLAFVISAFFPYVTNVKAQNQATVNVLESVGGSTDPSPGTYHYDDGTRVTLTATPATDLVFVSWSISSDTSNDTPTENPYTLTAKGGVTYNVSAVFAELNLFPTFPNPPQTSLPVSAYGTVTILPALGGSTIPAPGTYYFTSVYNFKLTATVNNGWKFDHWVITGDTNTTHGGFPFTLTPTDNPYTLACGLGYTYAYQPVFRAESTNPPTTTGGISTDLIIAIIAIIIAIIVAIASVIYVQRSKKP